MLTSTIPLSTHVSFCPRRKVVYFQLKRSWKITYPVQNHTFNSWPLVYKLAMQRSKLFNSLYQSKAITSKHNMNNTCEHLWPQLKLPWRIQWLRRTHPISNQDKLKQLNQRISKCCISIKTSKIKLFVITKWKLPNKTVLVLGIFLFSFLFDKMLKISTII